MASLNTVFDVIRRQNGGNPIVLNFPTTGHQAFQIGSAVAVGTFTNPAAFIDEPLGFPIGSVSAVPFAVAVGGTFSLGGQVQFQLDLNMGTGLASTLASTGKITAGAGPFTDNWLIEIEGMWDPISTNVRGIYYGWVGGTQIAQAPLNGPYTAASLAALQFNVAATVLNANSINTFTLTEFSGDLV